jgi:hypothetical protein
LAALNLIFFFSGSQRIFAFFLSYLFSVDNPTLNRFYSAHYLLPFILAGLSILHLAALHQYGSTNPIGVNAQTDLIPFYPYYALKDLVGFFVLAVFAGFLVFFYPDILGHPDNNIPANPYQTPPHIVPEYENCSLISSLIMKNPTACGKTLITTEIWGKKIVGKSPFSILWDPDPKGWA